MWVALVELWLRKNVAVLGIHEVVIDLRLVSFSIVDQIDGIAVGRKVRLFDWQVRKLARQRCSGRLARRCRCTVVAWDSDI